MSGEAGGGYFYPDSADEERHYCTDYEICPTCLLCAGCCEGGDDHLPFAEAAPTAAGDKEN